MPDGSDIPVALGCGYLTVLQVQTHSGSGDFVRVVNV